MAFGASVDVLGGVVTRAALRTTSSPPGHARVGVRVGVLEARATLLEMHGCVHACMHTCIWVGAIRWRSRVGCLALRHSAIIKVSMN